MNWKNTIKSLRRKMNMSQEEFAKKLGVSFATINRYENGHFEPTIKVKRKITDLLKEYDVYIEDDSFEISASKEEMMILSDLLKDEMLKNEELIKKEADKDAKSKRKDYLAVLKSLKTNIDEKL